MSEPDEVTDWVIRTVEVLAEASQRELRQQFAGFSSEGESEVEQAQRRRIERDEGVG